MFTQDKKLSKQTAKEYVLQHLTDLGYEDIVIGEIKSVKERGAPSMIEVEFWIREERNESGKYRGWFSVWLENNKLYGEW